MSLVAWCRSPYNSCVVAKVERCDIYFFDRMMRWGIDAVHGMMDMRRVVALSGIMAASMVRFARSWH